MSRITIPTVDQSAAAAKQLLAAVHKQLGVVLNLMRLVGHRVRHAAAAICLVHTPRRAL